MTIHSVTVVLVFKPEEADSPITPHGGYEPLDGVSIYQVFTNTEEEFVQDWMLKQHAENPEWRFEMQSMNQTWDRAHIPMVNTTTGERISAT